MIGNGVDPQRFTPLPDEPAGWSLCERAPTPTVQRTHQAVVGVAPLRTDAHARPLGTHRVHHGPRTVDEPRAVRPHPQRQVGILSVRPWKALVEPTDGDEGRASVGHVGGDPPRRREAGRRAREVVRVEGVEAVTGMRVRVHGATEFKDFDALTFEVQGVTPLPA